MTAADIDTSEAAESEDADAGDDAPKDEDSDRFSPAADLPGLTAAEKKTIKSRSRPNATLIHETIRAEGQSELDRSINGLLFSAVAAGLSIGFSIVVQGLLQSHLPDAPWRELIVPLGYTVGFLIVVMGRQQLFTENTLTPVLELLYCRNLKTLSGVARLWALVLVGNLVGAYVFAAVLAHSSVLPPEVKASVAEISRGVYAHGFSTTFLGAVLAGWLIALMVWLLPAAGDSSPLIIALLTYVIGLGHFGHSIAGSVEALYLVNADQANWSDYLFRFFTPTILGNIVGGVALVAVLNYGQVANEIE